MNILVTGAWRCTETQLERLRAMGHSVAFQQQEADALVLSPQEVDAVICNNLFANHSIGEFSRLRYIQLTSVGYDRVPVTFIRERGIHLHNAASVYCAPMAEFAVSGVLCIYKKWRDFWAHQEYRRWQKQRDLIELSGKRVCIVGCGHLGQACARLFGAFGCFVVGVNRTVKEMDQYDRVVPLSGLLSEVTEADIVISAIAETPETRHLFSEDIFLPMKTGSIFVNLSRGTVVDTDALVAALKKTLAGAVLDVFEEEPLPVEHQLWTLPNVLVTPHNSYEGDGNAKRLEKLIFDNLRRFSEQYEIIRS